MCSHAFTANKKGAVHYRALYTAIHVEAVRQLIARKHVFPDTCMGIDLLTAANLLYHVRKMWAESVTIGWCMCVV